MVSRTVPTYCRQYCSQPPIALSFQFDKDNCIPSPRSWKKSWNLEHNPKVAELVISITEQWARDLCLHGKKHASVNEYYIIKQMLGYTQQKVITWTWQPRCSWTKISNWYLKLWSSKCISIFWLLCNRIGQSLLWHAFNLLFPSIRDSLADMLFMIRFLVNARVLYFSRRLLCDHISIDTGNMRYAISTYLVMTPHYSQIQDHILFKNKQLRLPSQEESRPYRFISYPSSPSSSWCSQWQKIHQTANH